MNDTMAQLPDNLPGRTRRKLIFIGTTRLHYDSRGNLRSSNPVMSLEEWDSFLYIFKEIVIIARIDESFISDDGYILDHPRIEVIGLPFYDGPLGFYLSRNNISRFISEHIRDPKAVYLTWVPSPLALLVARAVHRIGGSLIVRVVGDAAGVGQAIVPRPFNVLAARSAIYAARQTVASADGVIYVTLGWLQKLYPAKKGAKTLARTNMKFPSELSTIFRKHVHDINSTPYRLIAVGSQQQNYKGHDLLIKAVAELQREGFDLSLTLVGTGRFHHKLVTLAKNEDIHNIEFIERIGTSLDVARYVSKFDLFVMPSRTEGMPKALMEAMAVGVLSIGSTAGGIPELLEEDAIFVSGSVSSLRDRIRVMMRNPALADRQRQRQAEMINRIKTDYSGSAVMVKFLNDYVAYIDRGQVS